MSSTFTLPKSDSQPVTAQFTRHMCGSSVAPTTLRQGHKPQTGDLLNNHQNPPAAVSEYGEKMEPGMTVYGGGGHQKVCRDIGRCESPLVRNNLTLVGEMFGTSCDC